MRLTLRIRVRAGRDRPLLCAPCTTIAPSLRSLRKFSGDYRNSRAENTLLTTKDTKSTKFGVIIFRTLRVLRGEKSVPPWRPLRLCARQSETNRCAKRTLRKLLCVFRVLCGHSSFLRLRLRRARRSVVDSLHALHPLQGRRQIGDQIRRILDTDGVAN